MKQRFHRFVALVVTTLFTFLQACTMTSSGPDAPLVTALQDRGTLALSSTNPYLAANQFVMLQASLYPVIHGFLENRGIPEAIDVKKPVFGNESVRYYYPEAREFFVFEKSGNTWTINGPRGISGETLAEIFRSRGRDTPPPVLDPITLNQYGVIPAPLRVAGNAPAIQSPYEGSQKVVPHAAGVPAVSRTTDESDPFIDRLNRLNETASSTPFKSVAPHDEFDTTRQSSTHAGESAFSVMMKKIKTQQKATNNADSKRSPNGDLMHKVESPKETLAIIAAWYTHEPQMSDQLARINSANHRRLTPGETIIIPSYMVRFGKQLSKQEVEQLLEPLEPAALLPSVSPSTK